MANITQITLEETSTTYDILDAGAMRTVTSPTAGHILLTDADGQAIDGGVGLGSKQNAVLSGTTEPTSAQGVDGDIYILYTV